jgi:hypothetical protein
MNNGYVFTTRCILMSCPWFRTGLTSKEEAYKLEREHWKKYHEEDS